MLTVTSPADASGGSHPHVAHDGILLKATLVAGPLLALSGGIVSLGLTHALTPAFVAVAALVPVSILVLLGVGIRRRRALYAAVVLINVEAVLVGALLRPGIALAFVLPMISIPLLQPHLSSRGLYRASVGAGLVAITGVTLAVLVGPASTVFAGTATLVTIASFSALVAFALALDWRVTLHLRSMRDEAEAELAARTRAERQLEHTSDLLAAIVDGSPLAVQAFTLDRTVTVWNAASERIFGWTADELIGHPMPAAMIPDDERQSANERIRRTIEGDSIRGDRVRRLAKDGTERWVEIYGSVLRDREGRPIGLAGQLADVTERVTLEAQLAHAQRLEAIGRLSGGVAHDFNNTLTAIGGFATLIAGEAGDETAVRADAAAIAEVVDRSRQLTGQLLAFARRSTLKPTLLDVRVAVTELEPVLCRLLDPGMEIVVRDTGVPLPARLDAGQLQQALANLVVNARDAMPGGGRVTVAVRGVDIEAGDLPNDPATAGSFVEVAVCDTGTGIAPEVLPSVFEPFFTTKPAGRGTGLGLALVRDFVRQSGGHACVKSVVGEGTRVILRFPVAAAPS